jgi:hypothetical protein
MNSNYAYVCFTKGISKIDLTKDGELFRLRYPYFTGDVILTGVSCYQRLKEDFPDRIKGNIVQQEDLMHVLNLIWNRLKREIATLPELDRYMVKRLERVRRFEIGGVLKLNDETVDLVNDLANRLLGLQLHVRSLTRSLS